MWLAGSFLMVWSTSESTQSVDLLMSNHSAASAPRFKIIGAAESRSLLRYAGEERNRRQLKHWEDIQLIYGAGFFLFLLFGTAEGRFPLGLALAMLCIVLLQHFVFTPELIALGRLADFLPDAAEAHKRLGVVQNATLGVEIFKWVVGAVLAVALISNQPRRPRDPREQVSLINKPNYRHVDG
jgi:hypothetical protein